MKPLNLPKESQESLLNGASMFLVPCEFVKEPMTRKGKNVGFTTTRKESPYKIDDEVYFEYDKCKHNFKLWQGRGYSPELKCTKCSCFKSEVYKSTYKETIKNTKAVKVQNLTISDVVNLGIKCNAENWRTFYDDVENWYNKQYGNYNENPSVFLYTIEEIK